MRPERAEIERESVAPDTTGEGSMSVFADGDVARAGDDRRAGPLEATPEIPVNGWPSLERPDAGSETLTSPVAGRSARPVTTDGPRESFWVDHARILAALAVVSVHVASGVLAKEDASGGSNWWAAMLVYSSGRWCVAVFVMLSGYLLLASDHAAAEPMERFYRKRASRLLVPLVFWSLFYSGWWIFRQNMTGVDYVSGDVVARLTGGRPYYHLWYLFMLPGLYVFTPFLQRLLRSTSSRELSWLCLATAVPAMLAFANSEFQAPLDTSVYGSARDGMWIHWFLLYLPYYLAGAVLGRSGTSLRAGPIAVVFGLTIAGTVLGAFQVDRIPGLADVNYFVGYLSITSMPMSVCAFLLIRKLNRPVLPARMTRRLAGLTFGIYLVHPVFLDAVKFAGLGPARFPAALSIPLVVLVVFAASTIASQFLAWNSVTRRLV